MTDFGWAFFGFCCNLIACGAAGFSLFASLSTTTFQDMWPISIVLLIIHTIWATHCYRKMGVAAARAMAEWREEAERLEKLDKMG